MRYFRRLPDDAIGAAKRHLTVEDFSQAPAGA